MFDLLQEEFQFGIYDAAGIQQYVGIGVITQAQADQITGQASSTMAQSSATQPVSSAPNSSATQSSVTN